MKIAIDLFALNQNYLGGVTTFALGLTTGLLQIGQHEHEIIIITSCENKKYFKEYYSEFNTEIRSIKVGKKFKYINNYLYILFIKKL